MERIKEIIKEKRPSLSEGSIKTYLSLLKKIYNITYEKEDYKIRKFNDTEKIFDKVRSLPLTTRKTVLVALYVLTDNPMYRDAMTNDINEIKKEIEKQELNEKQAESWVSSENIKSILKNHEAIADTVYKLISRHSLENTGQDFQLIQNYIILCLLGGEYIAPRRSKDYTDFKIKNIDTTKDNYLSGSKFIFNSYKTAKTYGKQEVPIPPTLKKIITRWIKINPTDYLLFDINFNPLSSVTLNQRLNKLFDNKVSVNQLRHTYLTERYRDDNDKINQLHKDMRLMGSSVNQRQTYIKMNTI